MNFDFSDDQKMLRDQARKFLTEKCPPKTVRKVLESDGQYDKGLWTQICEMGWTGTAIPEAYGGLGLGGCVPSASANVPTNSPAASFGRYFFFCSSVPASSSASVAR